MRGWPSPSSPVLIQLHLGQAHHRLACGHILTAPGAPSCESPLPPSSVPITLCQGHSAGLGRFLALWCYTLMCWPSHLTEMSLTVLPFTDPGNRHYTISKNPCLKGTKVPSPKIPSFPSFHHPQNPCGSITHPPRNFFSHESTIICKVQIK